ncbi:MAG: hypothetical protein KDB27_27195 [Planctomycetales bacterium]|nr:hypothetical protein [Planctomycetales bacterium]
MPPQKGRKYHLRPDFWDLVKDTSFGRNGLAKFKYKEGQLSPSLNSYDRAISGDGVSGKTLKAMCDTAAIRLRLANKAYEYFTHPDEELPADLIGQIAGITDNTPRVETQHPKLSDDHRFTDCEAESPPTQNSGPSKKTHGKALFIMLIVSAVAVIALALSRPSFSDELEKLNESIASLRSKKTEVRDDYELAKLLHVRAKLYSEKAKNFPAAIKDFEESIALRAPLIKQGRTRLESTQAASYYGCGKARLFHKNRDLERAWKDFDDCITVLSRVIPKVDVDKEKLRLEQLNTTLARSYAYKSVIYRKQKNEPAAKQAATEAKRIAPKNMQRSIRMILALKL